MMIDKSITNEAEVVLVVIKLEAANTNLMAHQLAIRLINWQGAFVHVPLDRSFHKDRLDFVMTVIDVIYDPFKSPCSLCHHDSYHLSYTARCLAGSLRPEYPSSAIFNDGSGLCRSFDEARSSGQGMATSFLPSQRRLPLLLRRHQRLFRSGYEEP